MQIFTFAAVIVLRMENYTLFFTIVTKTRSLAGGRYEEIRGEKTKALVDLSTRMLIYGAKCSLGRVVVRIRLTGRGKTKTQRSKNKIKIKARAIVFV